MITHQVEPFLYVYHPGVAPLVDADNPPEEYATPSLRLEWNQSPRLGPAFQNARAADEVPTTLLRLTAAVSDLLASEAAAGRGLSVLHHSAATGDIRLRRLLPLRELPEPRPYPFAVELNLPPADVLVGLSRHYLHAALSEALLDSLMAENRQRELHMDRALRRLDDDTERLRRACNAQRQAEIIEEIEILLLSAELLANPGSAS